MKLKEAAQKATPKEQLLEELMDSRVPKTEREHVAAREIERLRATLADTQDWSEVEALRESLREHMAEIQRLRAAGRQALDALEIAMKTPINEYLPREPLDAILALRATLSWDAMQRLTDVQQEMERPADTGKTSDHIPDATKMMASVREDRTVEPVGYFSINSYGNWEQNESGYGTPLYDAPPTSEESRQVEPVAYIHESGFFVKTPGTTLTAGMKLYASPPKREPLTEEEIRAVLISIDSETKRLPPGFFKFARAIERAHGIGGEE